MSGIFSERIALLVTADTGGAVKPLGQLEKGAKSADTSFSKMAKSIGITSSTLKAGLIAGATALVGTQLLSFLQESVTGFGEAAKAAGDLAAAMGGNVEDVSAMQAALVDAGISAEKSAGLMTKFTVAIGQKIGADTLKALNVEMVKGSDGATDYALTMVGAVDAIAQMGDAAQRNQALVDLFGRQGAQAFQDMLASGMSLQDAMDQMSESRIFNADDVAAAAAFDDAMDASAASVQGLSLTVGRALLPMVTAGTTVIVGLTDALQPLAAGLASIPAPVYLAVGGFIALKKAAQLEAVAVGISSVATAMTGIGAAGGAMTIAGTGARALAGGLAAAAAAAAPMLVLAGAVLLVTESMKSMERTTAAATSIDRTTVSLEEQARILVKTDTAWDTLLHSNNVQQAMEDITKSNVDAAKATQGNADATDEQRSAATRLLDVIGGGLGFMQTHRLATEEGQAAQHAYAVAMDDSASAAERAGAANATLADLIASGSASQQELTDAATAANEAQAVQNENTATAKALMGEYATTIQGAVEWLKALNDLQAGAETGLNSVQEKLVALGGLVNDPKTWGNEVTIGTAEAEDAILGLVSTWADSGLAQDQIIKLLVDLQDKEGTGKSADRVIQDVIDGIKGKDNTVPVNLNPSVSTDSAETARGQLDALGADKTVPVAVAVTGVGDAEHVLAGLSQDREVRLRTNVTGRGDAENVLNGLSQDREVRLRTNVTGRQDAENVLNGLSRDRQVDIYVKVHRTNLPVVGAPGPGGYSAATIGPSQFAAAPITYVTNTYQVDVSGAGNPAATAREIDRYFRRAGDRSKVTVAPV